MVVRLKTIASAHKIPFGLLIFARYDQKTETVNVLKKEKKTGNTVVIKINALLLTSRLIDIIKSKFDHTVKFHIRNKRFTAYIDGGPKTFIGEGSTFAEAILMLSKRYGL